MTQPAPLAFTQVGGIAQSQRLTGAKILGATIAAPELFGYWMGLIAEDEQEYKEVLETITDYAFEEYEYMLEGALKALPLFKAEPAQRLWFLDNKDGLGKTAMMWAEQLAKFPRDFEEDKADLIRLAEREALGTLVAAPPKQRAA